MPSKLIAESKTPNDERITLSLEGEYYAVRIGGELLMSSRQSGSEEEMARLALHGESLQLSAEPKILIGGLGIGFTLRAVLDLAEPNSKIVVLELIKEIVAWNQGVLAPCADNPLADPRVTVEVGDMIDYLVSTPHTFDAILLDIDNGPEAFTVDTNQQLYSVAGLSRVYQALNPNGVMVLWSAFKSASFERNLKAAGFTAKSVTVRARTKARKGARHTLFVAHKIS